MIHRVISYWRARKAQRQTEDFWRGYGTVMTDYFFDRTSTDDIQTKIEMISDWGEPMTDVEAGMLAARRRLADLERSIDEAVEVLEKVPYIDKPGKEIWTRYGRNWRNRIKDVTTHLEYQLNDH